MTVQDLAEFGSLKVITLANIAKKSSFLLTVEEFFQSEASLLIVSADMASDSKNRINMCKCIINNSRLKSKSDATTKHVCFILRID